MYEDALFYADQALQYDQDNFDILLAKARSHAFLY